MPYCYCISIQYINDPLPSLAAGPAPSRKDTLDADNRGLLQEAFCGGLSPDVTAHVSRRTYPGHFRIDGRYGRRIQSRLCESR